MGSKGRMGSKSSCQGVYPGSFFFSKLFEFSVSDLNTKSTFSGDRPFEPMPDLRLQTRNSKNAFSETLFGYGSGISKLCQDFEISKPSLQILEGKTFGAL
jgi:hypothetical protein